jgi:uncharacterized protein RhaS with RHS repeats
VSFIHADGFGSPRAVTNSAGTVLWQWTYASNPFGENAPTSSTGYTLNLRFPGQYFDVESGLSYNINRDYDAATGRSEPAIIEVRAAFGIPVGDYHTHGDYGRLDNGVFQHTDKAHSAYRDDCFSRRDIVLSETRFARTGNWTSYLDTPSKVMREYDPRLGIDSIIE